MNPQICAEHLCASLGVYGGGGCASLGVCSGSHTTGICASGCMGVDVGG